MSRIYSQNAVPDHPCGACGETRWGAVKWFHSNESDHRKVGCMNCHLPRVVHPDDAPEPDMWGEVVLTAAHGQTVPLTKEFGDRLGVFMVEAAIETQLSCSHKGCLRKDVEMHHYAPKQVFKWRADHWGTVPLCKTHHDEWHDELTNYWTVMKQTNGRHQ